MNNQEIISILNLNGEYMRIFNFLIFLWNMIVEIKEMIKALVDKEEKFLSKLLLIMVGFIFIYLGYKLFIKLDNLLILKCF